MLNIGDAVRFYRTRKYKDGREVVEADEKGIVQKLCKKRVQIVVRNKFGDLVKKSVEQKYITKIASVNYK